MQIDPSFLTFAGVEMCEASCCVEAEEDGELPVGSSIMPRAVGNPSAVPRRRGAAGPAGVNSLTEP